MSITKGDALNIIIATIVLAFAFSFKIDGSVTLQNWFAGFTIAFILVFISLLVHFSAQYVAAGNYLVDMHIGPFALGYIITLVLMLVSGGWLIFAALWSIKLKSTSSVGMKLRADPYKFAKIAFSGVAASLILAVICGALQSYIGSLADKLVLINVSLAISNTIPLLSLLPVVKFHSSGKSANHYATGDYIFFGSRPLWIFTFVFVLAAGIGLVLFNSVYVLLLSFLIAAGFWLAWMYFLEGHKPQV
jgi:hypothetical protein